jgi:hypothetical protein
VYEALGKSQRFKAEDFIVEPSPRKDGSGALQIRFRFDDAYTFQVEIPNVVEERSFYGDDDHKVKIGGVVNPGTLTQKERVAYTTKGELLSGITQWVDRIHEELLSVPTNRQLEEHQSQLEELMANVDELPDEFFTREEAEVLRDRLDELESQMRANIEAASATQKEAAAQVASLHADVELLKRSAESLKKRGWVGALMVRVKKWSANPENRELLKSGATVARTLLLGDGSTANK